jgi:RNA polymerase sigma-70 factor (ECF subfamily)
LGLNDQELIEEIRGGSMPAFELLMRRYEKLVYKIAVTHTGDADSAMDVSQNVFLKVHSKLSTYRDSGNFKSWIARIAMNESINLYRSRKRHRADQLEEEISIDRRPPQEETMNEKDKWKLLKRSILELNPKQQLAVALRYFEGMSPREIATVLECSEGTTKSILFRSLGKMRDQIAAVQEVPS